MPHYLYFSLVFVILTQNKIDHRIQDKCRMSFPANVPIITEYNGLTAKHRSRQTAIPASPFIKVTASHGSSSITTVEVTTHKIKSFFIMLQKYLLSLKFHSLSPVQDRPSAPPPFQSAEAKFYTPLRNTV